MAKFEKVSRFNDIDINIPVRATAHAAGYDFEVAEEIVVPSYAQIMKTIDNVINNLDEENRPKDNQAFPLEEIAPFMKKLGAKPTLVSTGMKCQLGDDEYLELSVRSSTPLKHWLIMANSVGIIDADYYNNESNEGEIFFQFINLSPFNIVLRKGDRIGQGIIKKYGKTEDDTATAKRTGGFGSTSN